MKKLTASLIFGLFAAISLTLTIACLFVQPCSETINNDRTFAALFVLSCLFIYLFLKAENKKQKKNLLTKKVIKIDLFFPTPQPVISIRKAGMQAAFSIIRIGLIYYGNKNLYIKISSFKAIHISF